MKYHYFKRDLMDMWHHGMFEVLFLALRLNLRHDDELILRVM